MSEWKTMESAPKDGRWFFAIFEGETMPVHCRYESGKGFNSYSMRVYSDNESGDFIATHWMPIPAPPESPHA